MTLVLSVEWRVSNYAKIHPLRCLRDNVSLEAVVGGIRGGKGGKGRGEEVSERKGWQVVLAEVHLGTQGRLCSLW